MRSFLITTAAISLSACTTVPQSKTVWVHDAISDADLHIQWSIDKAECMVYASQQIALPQMQLQSAPDQQSTTLTINQSGYYGSLSSKSSTSQSSFGSSFLEGLESGRRNKANRQQMEQYDAAIELRQDLRNACLYQRGWRTEIVHLS